MGRLQPFGRWAAKPADGLCCSLVLTQALAPAAAAPSSSAPTEAWGDLGPNPNRPNADANGRGRSSGNCGNFELTPLGFHLASLPLDPRLGKLLVLSCLCGCAACCNTAVSMAALQLANTASTARSLAPQAAEEPGSRTRGELALRSASDRALTAPSTRRLCRKGAHRGRRALRAEDRLRLAP